MESNYSREALIKFLDYAAEKGLVNSQTARGWRIAASKLLSDLSEGEEADVRAVDVDIAARKLANRDSGALSPSSLSDYRQRVTVAIQEFVRWNDDPAGYKPRGGNGKPRVKQSEENEGRQEKKAASKSTAGTAKENSTPVATSGGLPLAYPLRPDFLAQVVIPRDLKVEEAKRLGAFLLTLASDFSPESA